MTIENGQAIDANGLLAEFAKSRKMIAQNALNIIDNTAHAILPVGENANFVRDVYTDSNGYLNSVGGSTNGYYLSGRYYNQNKNLNSFSDSTEFKSGQSASYQLAKTITTNLGNVSVYTNQILDALGGYSVSCYIKFYYSDSTTADSNINSTTSSTFATFNYTNPNYTGNITDKEVTKIEVYCYSNVQGDEIWEQNDNWTILSFNIEDKIIELDFPTLSMTPTKAIIVSSNESISGTGSITYDLSTDGGINYQIGLISGTEITLTNTGTTAILKQNLNGVGPGNEVSTTDTGILYY